jgi:hypothetical protein
MHFKCGDDTVHGWCFQSAAGPIFLVPREEDWFIAFGTSEPPTRGMLVSALSAIGFVLGEDVGVGVFHSVRADSLGRGLFAMDLRGPISRRSRATPAVPLTDDTRRDLSSDVAEFVEKIIAYQVADPSAPISVAIHHYFESLDGLVEKQFLHAWIAAEAIASWAIEHGVFKATSKGRIADHTKWAAWVKSQRATIEGFANQGMADKLFGRVMESDAGRENDVQRVFKGEGIEWTAEMEDAEDARNSNAHEGRMPDRVRLEEMLQACRACLHHADRVAGATRWLFRRDLGSRQGAGADPHRSTALVESCHVGVDALLRLFALDAGASDRPMA